MTKGKAKPIKAKPAKAKPAKATAKPAKAKPAKAAPNPAGLAARPLRQLREHAASNHFLPAEEIYDAHASADAVPFDELILWLARQPGISPAIDWFRAVPKVVPVTARIEVLTRLAVTSYESQEPGYSAAPAAVLRWMYPALEADAAAVYAAVAARRDSPPWMPATLAMGDWLRGQPLDVERARAVAGLLAADQVREAYRLTAPPGRDRPMTARELGEAIAGRAAWAEALRHADRRFGRHRLSLMAEAFAEGNWAELEGSLLPCDHLPAIADEQAFVEVLRARGDADDVVLALADRLRAATQTSMFAELADLVVAARRLDRGDPVDALAQRLRFISSLPFALATTRRLLTSLPTEARLAIMKADRDRPGDALSVVALADHFDDELLDAYLARESLSGEVLGQLGTRVLAALEARLATVTHPTQSIRVSIALFFAIVGAAEQGHPLSDTLLRFAAVYPASHPNFGPLLAALPDGARAAVWRMAARDNEKPLDLTQLLRLQPPGDDVLVEIVPILRERAPNGPWDYMPAQVARVAQSIPPPPPPPSKAEQLAAACDAAPGPKVRIYGFEIGGAGPPAGSLTRLGAPPPRRQRLKHLLTIDLHDAPELAARFPDARALALYVPRVNDGTRGAFDETRLEPLDAKAAAALPVDATAKPFRLVPIDLPVNTFRDHESPLRQRLVNLSGYALGRPITIQAPFIDSDFVLQLNDDFDIELGDGGCLYVSEVEATWDCA